MIGFLLYMILGKLTVLLIGLYYYKSMSIPYKLVLALTFLAICFESVGFYISHILHKFNAWLFNYYMQIEVVLLGVVAMYFIEQVRLKRSIPVALAFNFGIWVYCVFTNTIYKFADIAMVSGCFLLTAWYMIILISRLDKINAFWKQPEVWLCISTILYFSCNIPNMAMSRYGATHAHFQSGNWFQSLNAINQVLNILRYPLLAVSFWFAGREMVQETIKQ